MRIPSTFIIAILLLLAVKATAAYADEISGTVIAQKDGKPLEGAVVTLSRQSGGILAFRQTDSDGNFSISLPVAVTDTLRIDIRLLGYKSVRILPPFAENMVVRMEEEYFEIPEAVVTAQKMEISNDTIRYYAPTLVTQGDRVLGDILTKLHGVTVSRDGFVQYLGRNISRMYIDSTDLLESRYNIATMNIDPRDIKSIEIYERHQHIKSLRGITSPNRAAINIILKDDAKGKWLGRLSAEAGGSTQKPWIPYSGRIFAMNVGGKIQSINSAETDASGKNIAVSLNPSTLSKMQEGLEFQYRYTPIDYLNISHTKAPLDDTRTRFNTTYTASTDSKFKAGNTLLGISGKFEHESLNSESTVRNIYDNGDGTVTDFTEINSVGSGEYYGSADLSAEINNSKFYFKDKLRLELEGSDADGHLDGTAVRDQDAAARNINLMNNMSFTMPYRNKHILNIKMFTQYIQQDESTSVIGPSEDSPAVQDIAGKYFYNTISYDHTLRLGRKWILATSTHLNYLYRNFNTSLNGLSLSGDAPAPITDNAVRLQYIQPKENLYLEFTHGKFSVGLGADIWYQYINSIMQEEERTDHNNLAFNPHLRLEYTFGPRFNISATALYALSEVNEQQLYEGLIMTNYKYLTQGRTELTQTPQWSSSLQLKYNDPAIGWAVDASASYSGSHSFTSTRYFIDDYIVNVMSNDITDYESAAANASVTKTFLDAGTKITASFNFSNTSSTINQNGIDYLYTGRNYGASLSLIGNISTWMGFNYNGSYNFSRYSTDGLWTSSGNHSSTHNLTLNFFPHKKLDISVSAEYYLDDTEGRDLSQTIFLDASVSYSISEKLRLFLTARNLLDSREYVYSALMPLQSIYYEYRIRPLNALLGLELIF